MTRLLILAAVAASGISLFGQQPTGPGESKPALVPRQELPEGSFMLPRGTRVPLALINSVSTKNSAPGDKLYLRSVFPVIVNGRILVPAGAYVTGLVTDVKRPGRVKGRGELHLRFEQMILPNGVIRDFTGSLAALEGTSDESLDRESGKVQSEGTKGEDASDVVRAAGTGAGIGTIAGAANGRTVRGLGVGSAAGTAAGLVGVLLTRGPDAILERGSHLEMVLDRDLTFSEAEVTFDNPLQEPPVIPSNNGAGNRNQSGNGGGLGLPPFFLQ